MQLLPLVGLIGLTGLVVASPTPSDSKASAPKRLVVYTEDDFQGPSLEIEATNRCVKLEAPVYKNLHSYGVVNQVCYFMDSEKCNSKKLFQVNAQGTESWGRVDVGGVNGHARRIAAVYCSDKAAKDFEADNTTGEVDSTLVKSRDNNAVAFESGYVEACKFNKAGSAMGPCTVVQALRKCKAFGSDFEKKIDVITQGRKCVCTYWENTDCKGRYVVESHNTGDGDYKPDMGHGGSEGHKISAVSCEPYSFSESVENRAVAAVAAPPPLVRACRTIDTSTSCVTKEALNTCKPNDDFFANHIDSVFQSSKSICTYWKSKDCTQGIIEVHNAGNVEHSLDQSLDNKDMKEIKAVSCKNIDSAQVLDAGHIRTVHTDRNPRNSIRSSPQATDVEQASFPPDGGDPGTIQVCTEYAFQAGSCKTYNVMNLCLALPQQLWRIVRSYNQAKGAHCEYYGGQSGCNEVRQRHETPDGQFWQAYNYDQIGFTHIWCTALTPELDQSADTSTPTEKRDLVQARNDKPGSVTVCSKFMFMGICETYNVLNLCLALPQPLWRNVKSLVIAKGVHCEFYGDDHGCRDVRVRYDLDKHGESDGYVYDDVGYTHVWCTAMNSPELDQTAANTTPTEKRDTTEPVPVSAAPARHEGQVLVSSWDSLRGKTQLVDTTTDDNNCAPLFNQIFWNLQSLLQYKGSVCTYWQYNCGKLSGEDKAVFTIDSRKGDAQLNDLPPSLGENRNKIAYIMCMNALLADEYMAKVDPADPTVFRAPAASDIAVRSPGTLSDTAKDFWRPDLTESPLWVCHNPNMAGQCFAYTGQCAPNPFNVDAIESLWLQKGYRCALYGVWNCDGNKGIPHYIDARDSDIVINDIEYQVWSIRCGPSPYRGEGETETVG